jgi:hypothetical protein
MQGKITTKKWVTCFENVAQFRYFGTTITNETQFRRKLKGD